MNRREIEENIKRYHKEDEEYQRRKQEEERQALQQRLLEEEEYQRRRNSGSNGTSIWDQKDAQGLSLRDGCGCITLLFLVGGAIMVEDFLTKHPFVKTLGLVAIAALVVVFIVKKFKKK